jgi:hypothetical protein
MEAGTSRLCRGRLQPARVACRERVYEAGSALYLAAAFWALRYLRQRFLAAFEIASRPARLSVRLAVAFFRGAFFRVDFVLEVFFFPAIGFSFAPGIPGAVHAVPAYGRFCIAKSGLAPSRGSEGSGEPVAFLEGREGPRSSSAAIRRPFL